MRSATENCAMSNARPNARSRAWSRVRSSAVVVPMFGWGDLNPLRWLGSAASEAVGQTWKAAMVAAWSSGLWVLDLAFQAVDAFTSPDLSADGPMREIYPYTFGLGLVVAVVMGFAQIGMAAFKRDGASIARVMVGVVQFAAVWVGYVAVAAALVTAASGLTHGLLQALVGVDGFSGYQPAGSWPREVTDTTTATVLGICAWLLIWPAAIGYLLVMLAREAALLLLVATSPIAAGGLLSEMGRTWFWRSLRWFLAAVLIAPLAALVLGVGQRIAAGVVSGAGDDTAKAVGMAVVSCLLILVGAICPLILFRLLAFVDPGTSSGVAMRTALASHGGVGGLLSGRAATGSTSAASQGDGQGRSAGESSADSTTSSRFAMAGGLLAGVGRVAQSSVGVAADVMGASGIGHAHPYYPPQAPERPRRPAQTARSTPDSQSADSQSADSGAPDDATGDPPAPPQGDGTGDPAPGPPVRPSTGPAPGSPPAASPVAGSAGPAAAGETGAAAAAAL